MFMTQSHRGAQPDQTTDDNRLSKSARLPKVTPRISSELSIWIFVCHGEKCRIQVHQENAWYKPWGRVFSCGKTMSDSFQMCSTFATVFGLDLDYINIPVQHMQAIEGQPEAC